MEFIEILEAQRQYLQRVNDMFKIIGKDKRLWCMETFIVRPYQVDRKVFETKSNELAFLNLIKDINYN